MRRDQRMVSALLSHGADPNAPLQNWTPTRRASDDFNFPPAFVGATPFWLAARVAEPEIMRQLVKHGADAQVVLRVAYTAGGGETGYIPRKEATTALMAATGMGGGRAWLLGPEPSAADTEARILEAAKIAVELGVDVNAANLDGRTALDAAEARKYKTVVEFLRANGAQPGKPQQRPRNSAQENR
jgi:ankyrin repeat protein